MTDNDATLREQFLLHQLGDRTESAALLSWFLENIWGVDSESVPEAICDKKGDKGIDGIVVDDETLEITLFQAKCFDNPSKKQQGDNDLRNFIGAAKWFSSPRAIEELLASTINRELRTLLKRNGMPDLLSEGNYSTSLVFVTNGDLNSDATDYVKVCQDAGQPQLEIWDRSRLTASLAHVMPKPLTRDVISLRTSGGLVQATMGGSKGDKIVIALVNGNELLKLPGIADRSLFSRNVRLYRGQTNVNKGLRESLQSSAEHPYFPAYHNGLTLLAERLDVKGDGSLELEGVGVVNGCQSLVTMFDNKASLTSKLRVVVKVVEIGSSPEHAEKITYRSNNQNAVTMRDQRSNDVVMRSLQSRISETFGDDFALAVRLGEEPAAKIVMDNTLAAQMITACYRQEPWAAVRKVRLFEDDFRIIF
ncbi:MAG: AIPR family protein, partial [Propionibacteriaceae bacterium]|nr:AIPR family protein [Propionibacteriaceae bacterium]